MGEKIFFIDLDGTLMRDDKTISEENRNALRRVVNSGNYIVLATGRAIANARKIVKNLGLVLPGSYLIAYNGAIIYDCSADCILSRRQLPIEYAEYLYDEAHAAGLYIQTYSDTQILTDNYSRELAFYLERSRMPYRIVKDKASLLDDEPPKMLLISLDNREKLERFRYDHMEWERGKCISFFSSPEYLEYCPLGSTKGYGIEYLERFLNIPEENTIAIGDQENDISMIRRAHIGVAMKNAAETVKDCADYISANDNNHNGVAEVIEKFI